MAYITDKGYFNLFDGVFQYCGLVRLEEEHILLSHLGDEGKTLMLYTGTKKCFKLKGEKSDLKHIVPLFENNVQIHTVNQDPRGIIFTVRESHVEYKTYHILLKDPKKLLLYYRELSNSEFKDVITLKNLRLL